MKGHWGCLLGISIGVPWYHRRVSQRDPLYFRAYWNRTDMVTLEFDLKAWLKFMYPWHSMLGGAHGVPEGVLQIGQRSHILGALRACAHLNPKSPVKNVCPPLRWRRIYIYIIYIYIHIYIIIFYILAQFPCLPSNPTLNALHQLRDKVERFVDSFSIFIRPRHNNVLGHKSCIYTVDPDPKVLVGSEPGYWLQLRIRLSWSYPYFENGRNCTRYEHPHLNVLRSIFYN